MKTPTELRDQFHVVMNLYPHVRSFYVVRSDLATAAHHLASVPVNTDQPQDWVDRVMGDHPGRMSSEDTVTALRGLMEYCTPALAAISPLVLPAIGAAARHLSSGLVGMSPQAEEQIARVVIDSVAAQTVGADVFKRPGDLLQQAVEYVAGPARVETHEWDSIAAHFQKLLAQGAPAADVVPVDVPPNHSWLLGQAIKALKEFGLPLEGEDPYDRAGQSTIRRSIARQKAEWLEACMDHGDAASMTDGCADPGQAGAAMADLMRSADPTHDNGELPRAAPVPAIDEGTVGAGKNDPARYPPSGEGAWRASVEQRLKSLADRIGAVEDAGDNGLHF